MRSVIYFSLFFFFAFHSAALSQGITDQIGVDEQRGPFINAIEKEAGRLYKEGNYYGAMQLYMEALKGDTMNPQSLEGLGNAAYALYSLNRAEWAYSTMLQFNMGKADQSTLLRLAEVKFKQGKYLEAKGIFEEYLEYFDNHPEATLGAAEEAQAKERIGTCDWAEDLRKSADMMRVDTVMPMDSLVNTIFSEYSPRLFEDKLYFSSYRFPYVNDEEVPQRRLIKMMRTAPDCDPLQTNTAEVIAENSGAQHNAHAAFSSDGQQMFYCECAYTKGLLYRCDIYRRKRNGDTWGPAEKLPNTVNDPQYTNTEPAYGKLADGREVLFFVSNRPGKGDRDIWYGVISGNDFSAPINLTINTEKDDVTPFFHDKTQTLYFSTVGLRTLGGHDIYKSAFQNGNWSTPHHTGPELNTPANDVYFSLSPGGCYGFLASNKDGALKFNEDACCYDIFRVNLHSPEMIAVNFNSETKDSLPETVMRLLTIENGVPSEEIKVKVGPPSHSFSVQEGKKYLLISEKEYFTSDTVAFSVPYCSCEDTILQKLYLKPPPDLDLVAKAIGLCGDEVRTLDSVTYKLYMRGKEGEAGLIEDLVLDEKLKLVSTTMVAQSAAYRQKIKFKEVYFLFAEREGYFLEDPYPVSTQSLVVGRDTVLKLPDDALRLNSSELNCYRTIVYFFNDVPNKFYEEPKDSNSNVYLYKLSQTYFAQKDDFIKILTGKNAVDMTLPDAMKLDTFFEKDVRSDGYEKLFKLHEILQTAVFQTNDTVVITLKGHASKLGNPAYNKALSNRRIRSVENFFSIHDGRVLKDHIGKIGSKGSQSKRIRIIEQPEGSDGSMEPVFNTGDKKRDRILKVYSVEASKERRVEIIDIRRIPEATENSITRKQ